MDRAPGLSVRLKLTLSYAGFLMVAGIPSISYGPGDLRVAHAVDEHVSIDELVTACKTFALLAADWCGVTA